MHTIRILNFEIHHVEKWISVLLNSSSIVEDGVWILLWFAVKMFYNHDYLIGTIHETIFMQLLPNVEQKICPKTIKIPFEPLMLVTTTVIHWK